MKAPLNDQQLSMVFARKPENDFASYIHAYYRACQRRFDGIEAIAGKWMFRDLMPGMSDFDTRLIVRDGMKAEDWCRMSTAIGEAHLELCRKYPCWARNLEHLPGINLSWSELVSENTYYPEFQQWSFYYSENPSKVGAALEWLGNRIWDAKDEYFHLRKFSSYFGRYNRSIDPPINMGIHKNKYALHSRIMHYFTPAVQSAMSLLEKRSVAGKFDALEIAQRRFPKLNCWGAVNEILHANYEVPRRYEEPLLSELEDDLEDALRLISRDVRSTLTFTAQSLGEDASTWNNNLQKAVVDPALVIFDSIKFSRLMKGRLFFYVNAPEHFETAWLIGNELKRIGRDFFRIPFATYWKIKTGEQVFDPVSILDELRGKLLTPAEVAATKEFARLTPGCWEPGQERTIALAIANVFDEFYSALSCLFESVTTRTLRTLEKRGVLRDNDRANGNH